MKNPQIFKSRGSNFVFSMFLECFQIGMGLHSHTYYANTHLFKNFIANFIAESDQTESKQKDDFVEESG